MTGTEPGQMDPWKFYDIIHRYHNIMNPMNEDRIDNLIDLLDLMKGSRVLDIGSGKGEMLIRLVEKYSVIGVGIDKSPYCIREAEKRRRQRVPRANLRFLEKDGAQYRPERGLLFDLTMCIGASWIYSGYIGTVKALMGMTKPNGQVMIGEPFWRKEPPKDYLDFEGFTRDSFDTHDGNVLRAEAEGLRIVYTLVSSEADWDNYEGLHWYAADKYALSNPKDPDLKELLARNSKAKESYFKWGREFSGWAIYLYRNHG